ncbi:COG4 transport protein-domain-containing protein [Leucosporidium creatinivorum]|uniref:Conserved oligomeric Golgi complex subunit 4 n=1 Tax=Leucosporidium creatinivorum TaxID=106004 RepID=A0A1Y2FXG8_9BASI|nr:COG4 transport protein-domain-containing protein [Leucosporidium creatinivorum]
MSPVPPISPSSVPHQPPPPLDLHSLTTRSQILAHLTSLTAHESSLDASLASLISNRQALSNQLNALQGLSQVVAGITGEAERMANQVGEVAQTAERVGGKVRVLDQEQSRVKSSIEVVQAVQDLKSSISSLDLAMQKQDWEAATRFMQRARGIDAEIVASKFAEAVVPTSDLPSTPSLTLSTLHSTLLDTFLTSFRTASSTGDTNNINRFFKLFPMIDEEEKGLGVYAEWVGGVLRSKSGGAAAAGAGGKTQSPTHFSTLLTTLFESIALIISQHQPVVEKYYGPGKMVFVAGALLEECDRLGEKVLSHWEQERRVARLLGELGAQVKAGGGGLAVGGGAMRHKSQKSNVSNVGSPMLGRGGMGEETAVEETVDPREVDALLGELSMMSGRWQLLRRFLYGRLKDTDDEPTSPAALPTTSPSTANPPSAAPLAEADETEDDSLPIVEHSALGNTIAKHLKSAYAPMEIWYLRSSVEKAHQMDELDPLSTPSLSSSLDDTFYILKKIPLSPTIHVQHRDLRQTVENGVVEVWRRRLEGAFVGVGGTGGAGLGGRAREEEKERKEREAKGVFMIYLNNLDTASGYTVRLIDELLAGEALQQAFFLESELERARIAMLGVRGVEERFRAVCKTGLDHLFNQLLRPRLRPILSDVYKDVTYLLDEEGYQEAEYADVVRKRFVKSWEGMMGGYRESLTPTNFNLFFATAVNVLVRPWEGMIRGMKFTELGALRLDRDVRSILSYLSSQSAFSSGSLRESFSRLQQIATLLTLDSPDEAEEVLAATGNRLTGGEVKSIWAMRV